LARVREIPFWAERLKGISPSLEPFEQLSRIPLLQKSDLLTEQKQHPPFGRLFTSTGDGLCRYTQTSGTSGNTLRWLDDLPSWQGMLDCWAMCYEMAGVGKLDRLFFPFSFGPFLGFWTAFEAATRQGILAVPGGGLSSEARLRMAADVDATVLLGTPSYLIHLGEKAKEDGTRVPKPRLLIVAGEPGGSIPATRKRLETLWNARVIDHSGMTEVGPVTVECVENPGGLHILESRYLAEILDPQTGLASDRGELVLTNLGRLSGPVLRYRTGDLVERDPHPCPCGFGGMRLKGGILGRLDDMVFIRGNNFHPQTLESILFGLPGLSEYRAVIHQPGGMARLEVIVEPESGTDADLLVDAADRAIRERCLFRAEVRATNPGTLPRAELKAKRTSIQS
jgi:phenylacetate-CoA ligase